LFILIFGLGFKLDDPANLGGRHVAALVRYLTADPTLVPELAARHARFTVPARPYSPAYIQQQLSFLRTFSGWIGKRGLVLPAEAYVRDKALVTRHGNAQADRSWSAAGVDFNTIVAAVAKRDPVVALQLEVLYVFGLRRKEAVMFSPATAEIPADALPVSAEPGRYLMFLRVKRGTKGGRLRYIAIRNAYQEQVLARALAVAPRPGQHIGHPGWPLKKALDHFSYVLRAEGVTKRALGVTPHGLRHQFAVDLYFELTEVPAPIRGGGPVDPEARHAAYREVARQLGHGRPRISGAYLGSPSAGRPSGASPET
jgi:integrase